MENKLLENEEIVSESAETIEEVSAEEASVENNVEDIVAEETEEVAVAEAVAEEATQAEPEIEVAPVEEAASAPAEEEIPVTDKKEKVKEYVAENEEGISFFKTAKWKKIWNKITTALLIGIMALPLIILIYILSYFLMR